MASLLRHHGTPGLQAQNVVRTVKTAASASEIGTTFKNVWPTSAMKSEHFLAHDKTIILLLTRAATCETDGAMQVASIQGAIKMR